jgi:hypothetical protein
MGLICFPEKRSRGEEKRKVREDGWGVSSCLPSPLRFVAGLGCSGWSACPRMGVRAWGSPRLGGLPLLFFPFLLVGLRSWLAVFPARLFCGVFVFLACSVAGCQVASRLSSRSVSFPLFFSYYTIVLWFLVFFFGIFVGFFCADGWSIAR